jgi:hypothetical protein
MKYVYLFNVEGTNVYKIGNSKHPEKRTSEVQTGCPFKIIEVARFKSKYPTKVETALHRKFGFQKQDEYGRELQGEFFALSIEDKDTFLEHCQTLENNFIILENNPFFNKKKV